MKNKIGKLETIIFTGGAVVMILELIGSRLLAPYLGTSIFVWSALIGIILGALSIGYYLGGKFSENNPRLEFLTQILFVSAMTIVFITIIAEPVLNFSMSLGVKFGSVLATLALFLIPSVILGMVSPYAIRLKIQNIESSGGVAGNLYALSTMGSIFGTFLAGFYLIPTFGSIQILFALALVLVLISLFKGKKTAKIILVIIIITLWLINQSAESKYVYEADSAYNHIRVVDSIDKKSGKDIRLLYLATETHSAIFKDSNEIFSSYHKIYLLDNLFKPEIKNALTLGAGAYVAPVNFLSRYPEAEMTVVEIDPAVTQVAKDYFQLAGQERINIIHQDARIFLNNNKEKFDVIYGDAFASFYSIPFQLTTVQAIEKIYNSLEDDGVLILNVISSLEGEQSKFFQAEYLTLKKIFPQIYIFPTYFYNEQGVNQHQNIIIFASKNPNRLTKEDLLKNADFEQKEWVGHFWEKEIKIDPKLKILTDNFAPVDYYISKLL